MENKDPKVVLKLDNNFYDKFHCCIIMGNLKSDPNNIGRKVHSHDYIEIAYVAEGRGKHFVNGEYYDAKKGDVYIINYDIEHCFYALDDQNTENLTIINYCFIPDFIENLKIEFSLIMEIVQAFLYSSMYPDEIPFAPFLQLEGERLKIIDDIFKRMYREYMLKEIGYEDILKLKLYDLLINLFRLYKEDNNYHIARVSYKYEMLSGAINFMKDNFSEKINLEEISSIAFLSKNYFCRVFKEVTGINVFDYIQKLRISKACELLSVTNKDIAQIAEEVGYTDYRYFNKTFKKLMGSTASEYRKDNEKD